ncbi:hypothetical protein [Lawsonibacter celer]|uniref:hypothetical protein n=1 Tax=Lawsonibacter celer TaxID=2986526 RepID=UPI0016475F5D|nr:hypothetical protein [Lawsonibacter celer]
MLNENDAAFERCPPYGKGAFGYGREDVAILEEMLYFMRYFMDEMDSTQVYHFRSYMQTYERYVKRRCRYFFELGSRHGATVALDIYHREYDEMMKEYLAEPAEEKNGPPGDSG